ncbi:MAG TPA: hypothetical protein VIM11_28280 [Tepidisphaeraceae bacterium]
MTDRRVLDYCHAPARRRLPWTQISRAVAIGLGMLWIICVVVLILGFVLTKSARDW